MPLNTSTYMQSQGWAGQGNPLGLNGSGLKKPLAIPQKRGLKGIGKDRDRANEWWDCLFEASAKALALPSAASSPQTNTAPSSSFTPTSTTSAARLSLIASAKRESAKKALMAGFVRGKVHLEWSEKQREKESAMLNAAPSTSRKEAASSGSEAPPRLTARKEKEAAVVPVPMQMKSAQKEDKAQRRMERLRVKEAEKREKEERRARREAKRRKKEEQNAKVGSLTANSGEEEKLRDAKLELGSGDTTKPRDGDARTEEGDKKKKKKKKKERKAERSRKSLGGDASTRTRNDEGKTRKRKRQA